MVGGGWLLACLPAWFCQFALLLLLLLFCLCGGWVDEWLGGLVCIAFMSDARQVPSAATSMR